METKVKTIITDLDELFKETCTDIDPRKEGRVMQEIVLALKSTMRENNLLSLSAPQIGYFKRICCLKFGENDYRTFINPMIINASGITLSRETCSSLPDKEYIVPRNVKITVVYLTPMGKIMTNEVQGRTAFVLQHCIAHLDGMCIADIGLPIKDMTDENVLDMWDKATEEERDEVLRDYMASLDLKQKELEASVETDDDAKQTSDAIKFIASVRAGETKLESFEDLGVKVESESENTEE